MNQHQCFVSESYAADVSSDAITDTNLATSLLQSSFLQRNHHRMTLPHSRVLSCFATIMAASDTAS